MRIVAIGATGLVGSLLAERLLAAGHDVHAVLRRPSGRTHERWREHVAPVADWPGIVAGIAADAAVSTLGTTRAAAGSEAAFRAIDRDAVVAFARATRSAGGRRMLSVSLVGADAASRGFYLRTKGETEAALTGMGFDRVDILRPGLLRGTRDGPLRIAERIGIAVSPVANLFLRGRWARYAAIDARVVADAAAACLTREEPGAFVHENPDLIALAGETPRSGARG